MIRIGEISQTIGQIIRRQAGIICLEEGKHGVGGGYGILHIIERHASQIKEFGYDSVMDFVKEIVNDFSEIYEERGSRLLLVRRGEPNLVAIIELRASNKEDFYSVISAWPVTRSGYFARKKLLLSIGERTSKAPLPNGDPLRTVETDAGNDSPQRGGRKKQP